MLQILGPPVGRAFGYASICSAPQSLHRQHSVLVNSGVAVDRIFSEHSAGVGRRPALAALTERVCEGDSVAVLGVHRLGLTSVEIVDRLIDFNDRGIGLRILRNTVAVSEEPLQPGPFGRIRPIGRPRALDASTIAFAHRMIADGVSKTAVAKALGVSRPTLYKALDRP